MADAFLAVDGLTVRFGGLTAVNDLSWHADKGEIVGIIGPNGAGKSTLFAATLGTLTEARGRVRIDGVDASSWPAHRRARAGLGRTFQKLEVFGSMTVRENLELATEAPALGARPWRLLTRDRYRRPEVARAALRDLGLDDVADETVAALPVGTKRLVELGRAICAEPTMLLLDEPSSGLDDRETALFADRVRALVADRGIGVVLVEHDMRLVLTLCERIYVLDFGELIATGTAAEIRDNRAVREVYLGSGDVA